MKLICYLHDRPPIDLRPAPVTRDWMDRSNQRFAYRCLPLSIANAHGWEIGCEESFEAEWNGGQGKDAITISAAPNVPPPAISHFGEGVLTFHVKCLFRTEPGWNLIAMGSPNRPKAGIQALVGIIETDWAPYTFTMNWIFTDTNRKIRFEKGEPICFLFPIPRGVVDRTDPELRSLRSDPQLYQQHTAWVASRSAFNQDLSSPSSAAVQQRWQRNYHQGKLPDGSELQGDHQTKVTAKPFRSLA